MKNLTAVLFAIAGIALIFGLFNIVHSFGNG
jgi:hypothetical protein